MFWHFGLQSCSRLHLTPDPNLKSQREYERSPDVEFFAEHLDAVEVSHGSVHGVLIAHLHQRRAGNTLHELHLQTQPTTGTSDGGKKENKTKTQI